MATKPALATGCIVLFLVLETFPCQAKEGEHREEEAGDDEDQARDREEGPDVHARDDEDNHAKDGEEHEVGGSNHLVFSR